MTRTTIPNLTLFSGIKIILKSSFYIKTLDRFQDKCQIFRFRTYPEFKSLSRFRDKPHFPEYYQNFFELENDKFAELAHFLHSALEMDHLLVLELISPEIGCFVEPLKSLNSFNV